MTIPPGPILHNPPNHLLRIDAIWAFVSVDAAGNEGLCAMPLPGLPGPIPLIAADEARLRSLLPMAERLAAASKMRIRLIKLSTREEILAIGPDGKQEGTGGAPSPAYVCPWCGAASHHPKDRQERFCARCDRFEDEPRASP